MQTNNRLRYTSPQEIIEICFTVESCAQTVHSNCSHHELAILHNRFDSKQSYLAYCDKENILISYIDTLHTFQTIPRSLFGNILRLCFLNTHELVIAEYKTLHVWNIYKQCIITSTKTEFLPCFCIPHRNRVIFFLGARIGVWNVNTSTIVQQFSDTMIFELLPWENSILAGGPDSTITVWSLDTLVPIRKIMLPIFCEGIAVMSRWDDNCVIVSNTDSNDYLLVYDIVNETEKQTISGVFDNEISVLRKMKDDKVVHITINHPGYELTVLDSKVNTVVFRLELKNNELGYCPYSVSGTIIALQDGDVIKVINTDNSYQIVQIDNCDETIDLCTN